MKNDINDTLLGSFVMCFMKTLYGHLYKTDTSLT